MKNLPVIRITFVSLGFLAFTAAGAIFAQSANSNTVWLDSLDLTKMTAGSGNPRANKSIDGGQIKLAGEVFEHGIGTHAVSALAIDLHRAATHFTATVGVDDEKSGAGSVTFCVTVDGKRAVETPTLHGGDKPQVISVDLTGAQSLLLEVRDGADGITNDHADWGGARITLADGATAKPESTALPPPAPDVGRLVIPSPSPLPAIHGPTVVGATPGRPFLFLIPATGDAPLSYAARNLPTGLSLDSDTGIISGQLTAAGRTDVELTVRNAKGSMQRSLTILGGDHLLAQTPPMGWNSWDTFMHDVDDKKIRAIGDAFVSSGLAAHGYSYVSLDDTWEGVRGSDGIIKTNEKFPDMKALTDYLHGKGLKFGIYSSPGPKTCGGFEGSYRHEDQDAQTYADWGVDYLKYDWCTYAKIASKNPTLDEFQKPYAIMRTSLDKTNRDIVFSYCQYGMGDVWKWGAQVGGNLWRTNGDLEDVWPALQGTFESQNGHEKYAGPGHWNDPDFLSVGWFDWGQVRPSRLTQNEQILQFSVWSLIAAPLMIGGDASRLDPFTLGLLTNDEAIAIDQDPLGHAAGLTRKDSNREIWSRPLSDGTHAVGLINVDDYPTTVTVNWSDLGITGPQKVRDIWMHQDMGTFNDGYSVEVPRHGCVLLKVGS